MSYTYKVKYVVIVEDENGNYIENAGEEFYDTESEAKEFADDMNADTF